MQNNIHENITNQILTAMTSATKFEMPWHTQTQLPTNAITNNAYNGINTLILWSSTLKHGYASNKFATYKQWQSIGGQVSKGSKGNQIIIYKPLPDQDDPTKPKVLLRSATVFNIEQISGIDPQPISKHLDQTEILNNVEQFITNTKALIEIKGDKACYIPSQDKILMPNRGLFTGTKTSSATEAYYSTLLHELTHWTGHTTRCDRDMRSRFGDESYAAEELIAELGAAFLSAELNITPTPRQDHANYLKSWIRVLENDSKAIFTASALASKATTYLNSLQPK